MSDFITILGARPQFVKAAVVSLALKKHGLRESIVHTGQHYDAAMSDIFFTELGLEPPVINLGIGSGPHGKQTALALIDIEQFLLSQTTPPKAVIVYGDTNSTLAGALAARKLEIPVIHIEAGLRSYNRSMPEETNRLLTDHMSDLLFCSSQLGVDQLRQERLTEGVHMSGDVMYDALKTFSDVAASKNIAEKFQDFMGDDYHLLTIHRPANTDSPEAMKSIMDAISMIDMPFIWPVHPRNSSLIENLDLPKNLVTMPPASYLEMLTLLKGAKKVFTDSGGLQKEAYWMKKPCVTLRTETEWVETLEGNWNQLTGPDKQMILESTTKEPTTHWKPLYGDGQASSLIAETLKSIF